MFHPIDMTTWERAERYRHYMDTARCTYSLTAMVDIAALCRGAKERGLRRAVASSTRYEMVERILAEVGVLPYLDVIVSGQQCRESKPAPEIYLRTAELLGVRPEECTAIEDSTVGITAAHRAGVRVIALRDDRFNFDRSLADGEIGSLSVFIGLWEGADEAVTPAVASCFSGRIADRAFR